MFFFNFGLVWGISKMFDKYGEYTGTYYLDFNIDGLPIHKSSKNEFWPILCMINNFSHEPPFIIALYYGNEKPPLMDFLHSFVIELKDLN